MALTGRVLALAGRGAAVVGLLFASVGPVGAGGSDSSLIHGCVQKIGGRLRVVAATEACLPSEIAIDWSRGGSPSVPPPASTLQVVDAAGNVVGPVVSLTTLTPAVLIRTATLLFTLQLVGSTLQGYDAVYFDGAGCTGQAYVLRYGTALPVTAVDASGRVFVDDGKGLLGVVPIASYDYGGCSDAVFSMPAVPAVLALDLGAQFTAPFGLR